MGADWSAALGRLGVFLSPALAWPGTLADFARAGCAGGDDLAVHPRTWVASFPERHLTRPLPRASITPILYAIILL